MQIVVEKVGLPEKGHVEFGLHRSFEIQVTSEEARAKVKQWLWTEVSMLLGTDTPSLVLDEAIVWRVPVILSAPGYGRLGAVGMVDVLVQTGEMLNLLQQKALIEQRAAELAKRLPAFQPLANVPAASMPIGITHAARVISVDE